MSDYTLEIALIGGFATVIVAIVKFLKPNGHGKFVQKETCVAMHQGLQAQVGDIKDGMKSMDGKVDKILLHMKVD